MTSVPKSKPAPASSRPAADIVRDAQAALAEVLHVPLHAIRLDFRVDGSSLTEAA
jgi:hypothetical protein